MLPRRTPAMCATRRGSACMTASAPPFGAMAIVCGALSRATTRARASARSNSDFCTRWPRSMVLRWRCWTRVLEIAKLRDDAFEKLSLSMLECVVRLHAVGVVHLDVKPHNFVIVNGEARLIDFESAVLLADGTSCVSVDEVVCTPRFAAPEVLEDGEQPFLIGRPADAFALGRSLSYTAQAYTTSCTSTTQRCAR